MSRPPADSETPEIAPVRSAEERAEALRNLHWYSRIPEGGRAFFWAVYFGIFVLASVLGIVIALIQMALENRHLMYNPYSSMFILITGTFGELWCFHRCLNLYMLSKPGKAFARWGIYVAGSALTLAFSLAVVIVVLYMMQ